MSQSIAFLIEGIAPIAAMIAAAYAAYAAWRAQRALSPPRVKRSASFKRSHARAGSWSVMCSSWHSIFRRTSASPHSSNFGNASSCMADMSETPNVQIEGQAAVGLSRLNDGFDTVATKLGE